MIFVDSFSSLGHTFFVFYIPSERVIGALIARRRRAQLRRRRRSLRGGGPQVNRVLHPREANEDRQLRRNSPNLRSMSKVDLEVRFSTPRMPTEPRDDVLLVQVQGTVLLNLPSVRTRLVEGRRFVKSISVAQRQPMREID